MTHTKGQKQNNKGKVWTKEQIAQMKKLAQGNTPTRLIANSLGRTTASVQIKASDLGLSLKPVNRPPYNRRKK